MNAKDMIAIKEVREIVVGDYASSKPCDVRTEYYIYWNGKLIQQEPTMTRAYAVARLLQAMH